MLKLNVNIELLLNTYLLVIEIIEIFNRCCLIKFYIEINYIDAYNQYK